MRKPMRFSKRRIPGTPPPLKNIVAVTMVLFVVISALSIWLIDEGIKPTLMEIAERKTEEFASRAINSAVKFAEDYTFEDFTKMTTDDQGNITTFGWNSEVVNEINRVATDRVEEFFISMNEGRQPRYEESLNEPVEYDDRAENLPKKDPTVIEIPLGQATGNTVLANLGPTIPVNLNLVGSVRTDIVHVKENLGINGALITLYVMVEADVQIVVPFITDVKEVSTKIYIDKRVVMGDIPQFFGGDGGPVLSIPKEEIEEDK
ncbi:sporulation protein YunB [Virgibacillus kekensis]|uniref:Sporulation protein YunB n=1 Tax=Virgibacillus kekensis TaxID=202261 RepID=A0ABV9DIL7_9BACI